MIKERFLPRIEGHCFLEKDAEWDKQDVPWLRIPMGADQSCLARLTPRATSESEWMDTQGEGTFQICWAHVKESSETCKAHLAAGSGVVLAGDEIRLPPC